MEWWTHLWLNEGFATWIEYLCVDHTHPEYEIWTNFLSREYASAMSLDALANSHPIEVCFSLVPRPHPPRGGKRGLVRLAEFLVFHM